jgi:hypothetical protein
VSDDAERLDAALNRRRIGASVDNLPAPFRDLVELAVEVGAACSAPLLSRAEREALYAAALSRVEAGRQRPSWRRLSPQDAVLLTGAAAATAVAAALGVRALVGHRRQRVLSAAA